MNQPQFHAALSSQVAGFASVPAPDRVLRPAPRRLLFYTHALTHGGAERVMAMLACAFAEAGDKVMFVVDHVAVNHGIALGADIEFVQLGGSHLSQLRRLCALLKAWQPDWILSALASSNTKMSAAALTAGMSSRQIATWHGFPQAEPSLMSRAGYALLPFTARRAAHQVCVSDALLAHMQGQGVVAQRSSRIYNPVDMRGLDEAPRQTAPGHAPVILSAGRLAPVKDFPTLVRAFAALDQADAQLIILGEGAERTMIAQTAQACGVAARVHLPGHVHDMAPWFRKADLFVLPSLSESFSNVIVEALSYGLPVVATDCGGPREILEHGRFGALTPCGDVTAMTKAMAAACRDNGSGAGARRDRAREFDLASAFAQYDALLRRLAQQK